MKSRLLALTRGLTLGASPLVTSAGIVTAATPTTGPSGRGTCAVEASASKTDAVSDLRAFGDCELNRRLTTLSDLPSRIAASESITSADAAAIQGEISATTAGLTSLKATIDPETVIPAGRSDDSSHAERVVLRPWWNWRRDDQVRIAFVRDRR